MTVTIMTCGKLSQDAESLLTRRYGVCRLLPVLWEAVMFEVDMGGQIGQRWTPRKVAHRYLQLLTDHTHSSGLEADDG